MKKSVLAVWGAFVILAICALPVRAALPPSAYPNPESAAEDIDIKVISASKRVMEDDANLTRYDVEIRAEVQEVRKTGTALRKGVRIVIRYSAHNDKPDLRGLRRTGPQSQPILTKDSIYSAVLKVAGKGKDRYYYPGGGPDSTFGRPH